MSALPVGCDLFVRLRLSLTNRFNLLVLRLETSEHWVVFSSRKQRTPHTPIYYFISLSISRKNNCMIETLFH